MDKLFNGYNSGYVFWRDNVGMYGIDAAVNICGSYINTLLKRELPDDERRFCREMFFPMYEAIAKMFDPTRLVYPYGSDISNNRMETAYFHMNRNMSLACARSIDEAIRASNYKINHYNLELAAMSVISGYGFQRLNIILAHHIQKHESDGRYSDANKKWARNFTIPDESYAFIDSHAILIDGFAVYTRELYNAVNAEQFALPGIEERGEFVHGYEIKRVMMVDDDQGYVIGHNPGAVDPYVCWRFMIRDGERHYNWGVYGGEQTAVDSYHARLFVAFN